MPLYKYAVIDESGAHLEGSVDADNRNDAISQIKAGGYYIKSLEIDKPPLERSTVYTLIGSAIALLLTAAVIFFTPHSNSSPPLEEPPAETNEVSDSFSNTTQYVRDSDPEPKEKIYISQERADKYLGSAARQEMRDFLKDQGENSASEQELQLMLKFNERLEYHQERARSHPEEYQ